MRGRDGGVVSLTGSWAGNGVLGKVLGNEDMLEKSGGREVSEMSG